MRPLTLFVSCGIAVLSASVLSQAGAQPIVTPLPTAQTALLGRFARGPVNVPLEVTVADFTNTFGSGMLSAWPAEVQARQFFANGGTSLYVTRVAAAGTLGEALVGDANRATGLYGLRSLSNLRLLVAPELSLVPAETFSNVLAEVRRYVEPRQIFLLLDPPPGLSNATAVVNWVEATVPIDASFCALYFPYLQGSLDGSAVSAPASGAMAAIYSLSDAAAGIWRSPSGTGYLLNATGLTLNLSTADSDLLNTHNINAIRQFPGTGIVPWGARVLDRSNSANLYVPVVRTRLWASASIQRALTFAATEDDGDPLWSQIRAMVGDFLYGLFQRGAFAGTTSSTSYFVKCDSSTTTAADIAANRVNCYYGMALLRSAEFDLTSLTAKTYDSTLVPTSPTIDCGTAGPSLVLAYPTLPGLNYQLNSSVGLSSGIWTHIGTTAPGDGAWQRLIVATTNRLGFYRVSVSPAR